MVPSRTKRVLLQYFFYLKTEFFPFYSFALKKKLYICTIITNYINYGN